MSPFSSRYQELPFFHRATIDAFAARAAAEKVESERMLKQGPWFVSQAMFDDILEVGDKLDRYLVLGMAQVGAYLIAHRGDIFRVDSEHYANLMLPDVYSLVALALHPIPNMHFAVNTTGTEFDSMYYKGTNVDTDTLSAEFSVTTALQDSVGLAEKEIWTLPHYSGVRWASAAARSAVFGQTHLDSVQWVRSVFTFLAYSSMCALWDEEEKTPLPVSIQKKNEQMGAALGAMGNPGFGAVPLSSRVQFRSNLSLVVEFARQYKES